VINLVYSMVIARKPAPANPWLSRSVEFLLPTPIPVENFERMPVFTSSPYDYGVPDAPPVASVGPRLGAAPAAGGS
jgi:cytochrome c oxidase subunit 1